MIYASQVFINESSLINLGQAAAPAVISAAPKVARILPKLGGVGKFAAGTLASLGIYTGADRLGNYLMGTNAPPPPTNYKPYAKAGAALAGLGLTGIGIKRLLAKRAEEDPELSPVTDEDEDIELADINAE